MNHFKSLSEWFIYLFKAGILSRKLYLLAMGITERWSAFEIWVSLELNSMWSLKVKINHHSSTKFSFLFVEVEVKIQVHVLLTAIVVVVMVVDMVAILVVVMMVLMKKTKTFQPQSTPSPSSLCISSIVISKDLLWFVPPFLNIATVNCLKSLSSASFLVFFLRKSGLNCKIAFSARGHRCEIWCPHYT